jgi:hypothetical protein
MIGPKRSLAHKDVTAQVIANVWVGAQMANSIVMAMTVIDVHYREAQKGQELNKIPVLTAVIMAQPKPPLQPQIIFQVERF